MPLKILASLKFSSKDRVTNQFRQLFVPIFRSIMVIFPAAADFTVLTGYIRSRKRHDWPQSRRRTTKARRKIACLKALRTIS